MINNPLKLFPRNFQNLEFSAILYDCVLPEIDKKRPLDSWFYPGSFGDGGTVGRDCGCEPLALTETKITSNKMGGIVTKEDVSTLQGQETDGTFKKSHLIPTARNTRYSAHKPEEDSSNHSNAQSYHLSPEQKFERYVHHLMKRFQFAERIIGGEKGKKNYIDLIQKALFSGSFLPSQAPSLLPSATGTVFSSPTSETDPEFFAEGPLAQVNSDPVMSNIASQMREALGHLVLDMLTRKVPALEVYDTVFADYHLMLSDEDAQSKVLALTQLKTRDVANMWKETERKEGLPNPLLRVEIARDLFVLALWPIYQEMSKAHLLSAQTPVQSPPLSPETSRHFLKIPSGIATPSSLKEQSEEHGDKTPDSSPARKKVTISVKPLQEVLDTLCRTRRPFSGETFSSRKTEAEANSSKKQPFDSSKQQTEAIRKLSYDRLPKCPSNTVPITIKPSKLDLERQAAMLSLFDRMTGLISASPELSTVLKTGRWSHSAMFFSNLERVNVAISIHAVEKEKPQSVSASQSQQQQQQKKKKSFPVIYVNKAWEAMTGYGRQEAIGQEKSSLLQGEKTERSQMERIDYSLEEGLGLKLGVNHRRKDGSSWFDFLSLIPVYDSQGDYRYVVCKLYDVGKSTASLREVKHAEEVATLIALAMRYL